MTHTKYPRYRPELEECNAHKIMVIRCVEHKVRNENLTWIKSKIDEKLTSKMDLSKVAKVDKTCLQWLCKPLKNFPLVQTTHMKFPRGCLEPGECSAHWLMVIHCIEQKIRNENLAWVKFRYHSKNDFKNIVCPKFAKATKNNSCDFTGF